MYHIYLVLKSYCSFTLDEDGMSAVTVWIAGDFEKVSGRKLLLNALKHVVSIIYSPSCSALPILSTHHLVSTREHFKSHELQIDIYCMSCVYVCCCLLCVIKHKYSSYCSEINQEPLSF